MFVLKTLPGNVTLTIHTVQMQKLFQKRIGIRWTWKQMNQSDPTVSISFFIILCTIILGWYVTIN